MIKIWLKLGYLSLATFVLFFLFIKHANAAVVYDSSLNYNPGGDFSVSGDTRSHSFEVPTDCENPFLYFSGTSYSGHYPTNVKYNGVAFSARTYGAIYGSEKYLSVWSLANPASGTHTFQFDEPYGDRALQLFLFCNVDPDDPFEVDPDVYVESGGAASPSTLNQTNADNAIISSLGMYANSGYSQTLSGFTIPSARTSSYEQETAQFAYYIGSRNGTLEWGSLTTSSYSEIYAVLKYKSSIPAISASVYWAGVGVQHGQIGGTWSVPIYYNICSSYGSLADLYAVPVESGVGGADWGTSKELKSSDLIGPQACSGVVNWTYPVQETSATSGTAFIRLYSTADGDVATSSVFNYFVSSGLSPNNYLESAVVSPLIVYPSSATTTTIAFNYDFTGLTYASSTVCVFNNVSTSTTAYCADISAPSGYGAIAIPNPSSPYRLLGSFVWTSGGNILVRSNSFEVVFYDPNAPFLTSDVCSDVDGFAGTWCYLSENLFKPMFQSVVNQFLTLFPFNLLAQISNSWSTSASSTLPVALEVFDAIDNEGNLSISLPSAWVGTATTSFVVFGSDIFSYNSAMSIFFGSIRSLSTYLFWFIFLFAIYSLAKNLYLQLRE